MTVDNEARQSQNPSSMGKRELLWRWTIALVVVPLLGAFYSAMVFHARISRSITGTPFYLTYIFAIIVVLVSIVPVARKRQRRSWPGIIVVGLAATIVGLFFYFVA